MTTEKKPLTWREKRKLRLHAADILDTAVEVLDATGWCAHSLGDTRITKVDENGEHCAVGAIEAAATVLGDLSPKRSGVYVTGKPGSAYRSVVQAVYDQLPADVRSNFAEMYGRNPDKMGTRQQLSCIVHYNDSTLLDVSRKRGVGHGKGTLKRLYRKAARQLREGSTA